MEALGAIWCLSSNKQEVVFRVKTGRRKARVGWGEGGSCRAWWDALRRGGRVGREDDLDLKNFVCLSGGPLDAWAEDRAGAREPARQRGRLRAKGRGQGQALRSFCISSVRVSQSF